MMKKSILVVALAAAMMAAVPAASAQQTDPPKQGFSAKIKQKYLERRAKFVRRVKDVYFAVGCKVLGNEAGLHFTRKDNYLANVGEQPVLDLKEDQELVDAARQEGLNRAAKPGACDYYRKHPETAEAMRRSITEAAKQN